MDLQRLGQELLQRRKRFDIPQTAVARRAKVNRGTIAILERGAHPKTGKPVRPTPDILERLSVALSVDPLDQRRLFTRLLSLGGYEERLFGAKLAEYRERARMSQQTLAQLVDISLELLNRIEEGLTSASEVSSGTILVIVETLHLKPQEAEELVQLAGHSSQILQAVEGLAYSAPPLYGTHQPNVQFDQLLLALAKASFEPEVQQRCIEVITSFIAAVEEEKDDEMDK
jgi:transcriptional regulator with XRE-family HTH domain